MDLILITSKISSGLEVKSSSCHPLIFGLPDSKSKRQFGTNNHWRRILGAVSVARYEPVVPVNCKELTEQEEQLEENKLLNVLKKFGNICQHHT